MADLCVFAFLSPGPGEMLLLLLVALLLYGGNLPEVARTWGKTFAEFRRGLSSIQNDLNDAIYSEPERLEYRDDAYYSQGYEAAEVEDEEVAEAEESADGEQEAESLETPAYVEQSADEDAVEKPSE